MNEQDRHKKQAAEKAVEYITDGMIVGLGTGSTTAFAVHKIAQLIKENSLKKIRAIPSSKKTERLARRLQIPLTDFRKVLKIDVTIDGADEVDPHLNLIKGGGGALLREKILIQASKRVIIVVDGTKISKKLGTKCPVPIEVLPFAWELEARYLKGLKAKPKLRRDARKKPYLTDQKNYILDTDFGLIKDPEALNSKLNQHAGIIEHGLFVEMVTDIIVVGTKGNSHLKQYDLL